MPDASIVAGRPPHGDDFVTFPYHSTPSSRRIDWLECLVLFMCPGESQQSVTLRSRAGTRSCDWATGLESSTWLTCYVPTLHCLARR